MGVFPGALHVCTYDVRGTMLVTGETRRTRETGLVVHTHQLLDGLVRRHPQTRLTVTCTGAAEPGYLGLLRTPEGYRVHLQSVASQFPRYLRSPGFNNKCGHLVQHYYEHTIDDVDNPVWRSLAGQYAQAVRAAMAPDLVLQNINPLVSVLKAQEFGLLDPGLRLTAVIHDTADVSRRFGYVARHIARHGGGQLNLVAVSESVRQALAASGVPSARVRKIVNGLDVRTFQRRVRQAEADSVFARVRARNHLPATARVVLVSARRVPWKGHEDVIRAAHHLNERNRLADVCFAFNGKGMLDSRWPDHEAFLTHLIAGLNLSGKVFLLDDLSPEEVASCYAAADVAVLASREPEPFGYANIEAMLAGTPVIATGHGGPLEYIEDGISGFLVNPRDPLAVAAALERLLDDPSLSRRVAEEGKASAERFTLDAMVDAYEDTIMSAPADVKEPSR